MNQDIRSTKAFDPSSLDEATLHTQDVLDEVMSDLFGAGLISENKSLQLGLTHGVSYLTGTAEGLLSAAAVQATTDEEYSVTDWEDDIKSVIDFLVLAIVAGRLNSTRALLSDDIGGGGVPPLTGYAGLVAASFPGVVVLRA